MLKGKNSFKKKIFLGLLSAMAVFVIGCAGKSKEITITELGESLLSNITYEDELAAIDLDTAEMIYYLDNTEITNVCIYESSGATAEEIAVFECAASADANEAETAVRTRIEEQKESFENYVPEELVKLNNAVVIKSGKYVILSVSSDPDTARKIIEEAFQ